VDWLRCLVAEPFAELRCGVFVEFCRHPRDFTAFARDPLIDVGSHGRRFELRAVDDLVNVGEDAPSLCLGQPSPCGFFPFRGDSEGLAPIGCFRAALRTPAVGEREAPEPVFRKQFFSDRRHAVIVPAGNETGNDRYHFLLFPVFFYL